MNPGYTFDYLCPDCGHTLMEVNGVFECLNPECGTVELNSLEPDEAEQGDNGAE